MKDTQITTIVVRNLDSGGGPVQIDVRTTGKSVELSVHMEPESKFGGIPVIIGVADCRRLVEVIADALKAVEKEVELTHTIELYDSCSAQKNFIFIHVVAGYPAIHIGACLKNSDFEIIIGSSDGAKFAQVLTKVSKSLKSV